MGKKKWVDWKGSVDSSIPPELENLRIDCYDCPRRKGNYCHFYLSTCRLAKRSCTICITCKNANWINIVYKECEGCILGHEKNTRELNMGREEDEGIYPEEIYMGEDEPREDKLSEHYKFCAFLETFCKESQSPDDKCIKECRDELIELMNEVLC